uniref:Caspase family p20 domain-containing protein n=1 Tax=Acrobeloides nanus TaxID=290746 RepID=A0A914E1S2_9BILA
MEYDSCIVVIMGHGDDGIIYDIYGNAIDINHEILSLFNGTNAPGLAGKPKFFIFEACRGGNFDEGAVINQQKSSTQVSNSQSPNYLYESNNDFNNISKFLFETHDAQRVPLYSDFLVFYATVPTMVSYRYDLNDDLVNSPEMLSLEGSKFIAVIYEVFYKFAHIKDLEDMATIIKGRVGSQQVLVVNEQTKVIEIKYQQPQFVTTSSKKYFMFPGVYIESS